MKADIDELNRQFGNVDIYLLDHILKGLFQPHSQILDAGCDEGRNLIWFMRNGFTVFGIDRNEEAIQMLRHIARSINRDIPKENFIVGDVKQMPFFDCQFDAVISSAVLHFAENEKHFFSMIQELFRVLKSGGILFIRMTADTGLEDKIVPLGNGRFLIPDGSERFLLTRPLRQQLIAEFGFTFVEPIKSVLVDDLRCMSNLVLRKN